MFFDKLLSNIFKKKKKTVMIKEERENEIIKKKVDDNRYVYSISSQFAIGEIVTYEIYTVKIIDIEVAHDKDHFSESFYFRYLVEFVRETSQFARERKWVLEKDLKKFVEVEKEVD